jgi:hypothetical protein
MPSYEMTAEEANLYGSTLNVWQALRLLQTWHPLMSYGQRFVGESDPYKQSLVVSEAVEWLATKTDSTVDDGLVKHLADVLRTKEGESLVRILLGTRRSAVTREHRCTPTHPRCLCRRGDPGRALLGCGG